MRQDFANAVRAAVADEAQLRAALAEADIAPLLMVLVQLTGDTSLLDQVAPHIQGPWSFLETVPPEMKAALRDRLVTVLQDYAREGRAEPPRPDEATLARMMSAGVGQPVPAEYIPLLLEEMRFTPEDERAVRWRRQPAGLARFRVLIIGAGLTGLCTAIRLQEMGIPFTILEKNAELGGTWLENSYPGCAVDTPNHFFSFSFNPNDKWSRHFSRRDEILAYLRDMAAKYDLLRHIRFNVEVDRASFDPRRAQWQVELRHRDGGQETLSCNALVSAVGQLNRPALPDVAGIDDFEGPVFHTARWDHTAPLAGQRVAMLGTGASAMQAAPSIAPEAAELTVFQRSPHWAVNNPNYHREVAPGSTWALEHLPYYSQWLRFQLFWASSDGFHATLSPDPAWEQPALSLNAANHRMREMLVAHMRAELDGDEAMLAKVTPGYPPYGKRMLRDNHWYRMLKRPNVTLETGRIAQVERDGIRMQDGSFHPLDVIILATGFQASKMLWPMEIVGSEGRSIRDLWGDDDPRAYMGMTVPGFPNLFITYGPNTNLAHGGSIIFHTECQVRYICQALREMLEHDLATLDVKRDVHDAYNVKVDAACQRMVWAHPGVTSWYKNKHNRVTVTSPWRLLDYWRMTREFQPDDFIARAGADA